MVIVAVLAGVLVVLAGVLVVLALALAATAALAALAALAATATATLATLAGVLVGVIVGPSCQASPLCIALLEKSIQQHMRKTAMLRKKRDWIEFTLPAKISTVLAATETALLFGGLRQTGVSRAPGSKDSFVVNRSSSRHDGAGDDGSANERVLHVE